MRNRVGDVASARQDADSGGGNSLQLRRRYEAEGALTERYASSSFWDARYHLLRRNHIIRLLGPGLRGRASFLDVGCGTGEYLEFVTHLGSQHKVGVDLASTYLDRLRANDKRLPLVQANGSALPFADDSFDVVLCSEVIEHLPPATAARAAAEVFRVSCRSAIFTTPNSAAAIRRVARRFVPDRVDQLDAEVGHINLLDQTGLAALGNRSGFRLTKLEVKHIAPPVLGEVGRLPALLGHPIRGVERAADRIFPKTGNTMYAVFRSEANG